MESQTAVSRILSLINYITQPRLLRYFLFLLIWALGTIGYETSRQSSNVSESAYLALQMFALNFEPPATQLAFEPKGLLLLMRFVAAGFSVLTIVLLFSQRISIRLRMAFQSLKGNQFILLGYGQVNRMLAERLWVHGKDILIIDKEFSEVDREEAHQKGYLLKTLDLTDSSLLNLLPLDRARRVYVACGTDTTNLKIATQAVRQVIEGQKLRFGPGSIHKGPHAKLGYDGDQVPIVRAHISSPKFMHDLSNADDHSLTLGQGMSFFSLKSATARVLVQRARFVQRARDLGQSRPHLLVLGGGELAEEIICDALHANISGAQTPMITVLDNEIDLVQARFVARYPHFFDDALPFRHRPDIRFERADATLLNFENDPLLAKLETSSEPPTAWIFACRDDETNLESSLRLEAAMYKNRRRNVPVFKRIWQGDAIPLTPANTFGTSEIFGQRSDPILRRKLYEPEPDWLAKKIHTAYGFDKLGEDLVSEGGGTDAAPFTRHWLNLPETIRRSNHMAGVHLPQKLNDLGFAWRGSDLGVLPVLPKGTEVEDALRCAQALELDSKWPPTIYMCAETEHLRWMIERAISGWRHDENRSNRQHLHPDMVPFKNLALSTKKQDLTSLSVAFTLDKGDFRTDSAPAYVQRVFQSDINAIIDEAPPEGTTEVKLIYRTGTQVLGMNDLDRLTRFLSSFGKRASACRVQFVIVGQADFQISRPVVSKEGKTEERRELRSLLQWLQDATHDMPQDLIVDVTFLPDAST